MRGISLLVISLILLGAQANAQSLGARNNGKAVGTQAIPASFFGSHMIGALVTSPWVHPINSTAVRMWNGCPKWKDIEAADGIYVWTDFDRCLVAITGADLMYTIGATPAWASSNVGDASCIWGAGTCAPPSTMSKLGDFVASLVNRAAGRIRYWEPWNEFDSTASFDGTHVQLVSMSQQVYNAVHNNCATCLVLNPNVQGNSAAYLPDFWRLGGSAYTDIVGFHGYPWVLTDPVSPETFFTTIWPSYKAAIDSSGMNAKEIWDTESGWGLDTSLTSATLRVGFVARWSLLRWSLGISRAYWYAFDEPNWGTLYSGGALTTAGVAAQQIQLWMVGAVMNVPCKFSGTVWTCGLVRAGGYQAQAVWDTSGNSSYSVPGGYTQYHDLAGGKTTGLGATVTIGTSPILLENKDAF